MRPPQASIISLDVIVDDVTLQDGCTASCVASKRLAIACRFLDYPLLFIHPRSKQRESGRIKFNTGKSCALSEAPLYVLLFNYTRQSHPIVLGAGSAQLQLGSAGSSKPGDQHSVALYDPSGTRLGHARLRAHLVDHGQTLAAHLRQKLQPESVVPRARKGREESKKLHVHYHLDSPPPAHRSLNCKQHARAANRRGQRRCKHCSRERPMTGPAGRGQAQTDWLQSNEYAHALSAPSTPWHGPEETHDEKLQTQEKPVLDPCASVVKSCTACEQPTSFKCCDGTAQKVEKTHPMHNCTVCGSGHRFSAPATQDITAVACEMMTLVSMRTAMTEVLGNLVHKWKDVMPSSMDLPEMSGILKANGQDTKPDVSDRGLKVPVPTGVENQAKGVAEALGRQHAGAPTVPHAPSEQMLQTYEPDEAAQGHAGQRPARQPTDCDKQEEATDDVSNLKHSRSRSKLSRDSASGVGTKTTGGPKHNAMKGSSKERRKQHGSSSAQKVNAQREDSMSGPFQVSFAPSVLLNREQRRKRSSSRRTHSHRQRCKQDSGAVVVQPQAAEDQNLSSRELTYSTATQQVRSSTGLGWADSAVSGASISEAADTSAPNNELSAPQKSSISAASVPSVADDVAQATKSAVECANEHIVDCMSEGPVPPEQSEGLRSDSFWPLSDSDAAEVPDQSHGSGPEMKGINPANIPPRADSLSGSDAQTVHSDGSPRSQGSQQSKRKDLGTAKNGDDGKDGIRRPSEELHSIRSDPSTTYSSLNKSGGHTSESAHTVASSEARVPADQQGRMKMQMAADDPIATPPPITSENLPNKTQPESVSPVPSRQHSAISAFSISGSEISDGTLSLHGSVLPKSQAGVSARSRSFFTTSSISDGCSSSSQSSSPSSIASSSMRSESVQDHTNSGSPPTIITNASTRSGLRSGHGQRRSEASTDPGTIRSLHSDTYNSGYTQTTGGTSPCTVTEATDRQRSHPQTSVDNSMMQLDSSLHSDSEHQTTNPGAVHSIQSGSDTYDTYSSETRTSSGGESGMSSVQPGAAAALNGWHHPASHIAYPHHISQYQHMCHPQQMHYMHGVVAPDAWNSAQPEPAGGYRLQDRGFLMYPDVVDEVSEDETRTRSAPEASARMSEIDRSLAGTTMHSETDSDTSASGYSMASGDDSSESGGSLEP